MRTKRFLEMRKEGDYTVMIERINCDVYGNPKYNITVFDKNGIFRGNWNTVSYNINVSLENIIKEKKKIDWLKNTSFF